MNGILFLDFDGVLHPSTIEVDWVNEGGKMTPKAEGLFAHVDALARALEPFPDLRIVVSSSWRSMYPIEELREVLGPLGHRVIDTTGRRVGTRWQDIEGYLSRRAPVPWIACDDDDHGWPDDLRHQLIRPNPLVGLTSDDLSELVRRVGVIAAEFETEPEEEQLVREV